MRAFHCAHFFWHVFDLVVVSDFFIRAHSVASAECHSVIARALRSYERTPYLAPFSTVYIMFVWIVLEYFRPCLGLLSYVHRCPQFLWLTSSFSGLSLVAIHSSDFEKERRREHRTGPARQRNSALDPRYRSNA